MSQSNKKKRQLGLGSNAGVPNAIVRDGVVYQLLLYPPDNQPRLNADGTLRYGVAK